MASTKGASVHTSPAAFRTWSSSFAKTNVCSTASLTSSLLCFFFPLPSACSPHLLRSHNVVRSLAAEHVRVKCFASLWWEEETVECRLANLRDFGLGISGLLTHFKDNQGGRHCEGRENLTSAGVDSFSESR